MYVYIYKYIHLYIYTYIYIYIYIYNEYTRIAKTSPTDRSSMIEQADFTYSKGNLIKEKSKQIPP